MSHVYEAVIVPVTVKIATLHPPGVVSVVLVGGPTVRVLVEGALIITIPDPPFPP
jgi:hypothetical protein